MRKIKPTTKLLAVAMAASLSIMTIWVLNNQVSARTMPRCTGMCSAVFSFGMIGITAEQTARLSIVNTRKCANPGNCTPAEPVQVHLMFVKSDGNPVTNVDGQPIESGVTLMSDQSTSLDLRGSMLLGNNAGRVQIRAAVPSCVGCGTSQGFVIPTLEVFDNATGKTMLVMPDYPAISSNRGIGD